MAYLKASNTGAADLFGVSVAIFEDLIVVGAEGENSATGEEDDNSANNAGAAYLFRRTGTTWSQEAYLKASNPSAGDAFGTSSAISGNTIIVGAHLEDSSATGVNEDGSDNAAADSGAAYVFVNDGSGWREEAFLKASNADPADQFGFSVGLSDDIAVVGARFEDRNIEGLEDAGAAYIFVRNNGVWSQEDILRGTFPDANDRFGESVAISGETAVVGSLLEDSSSRGVNSGGGGSSSADQFGGSVAINKDTIVIGARAEDTLATGVNNVGEDNGAINSGSAYVFQRIGTTWAEEAYLKASNTDAADQFGFSVGVSVDTVVVGARFENGASREINEGEQDNSALNAGAAYIFTIPVKVVAMFPGYGGGITAAGLSGADASPLAIPFNDGVENILKYAFNLDLSGPDSRVLEVGGNAGLPRCSVIESGGERFFRLQYLEREDNQLVYTPQISSNLALDSFASVTGTRTEQVIDSEWSLITIDRRIDSASTPRDFFRVMVSFQ